MITRRKKIIIAVFIAAITVTASFAFLDYLYNRQTNFNGVYKFAPDPYYSGTPLPPSYQVPAYNYQHNLTGNFTAHYNLVSFPYYVWKNGTYGSFQFGITFGRSNSGFIYVPAAPANARILPLIWIGLVSANYNFSGFLGFKPLSLTAYTNIPFMNPINYTNNLEPSVWNMYTVNQTANISGGQVTVNTLGTVNYLYPVIPSNSTSTVISTLFPGQYYLVLKLDLYSITPFQTHFLTELTITEPWVYMD